MIAFPTGTSPSCCELADPDQGSNGEVKPRGKGLLQCVVDVRLTINTNLPILKSGLFDPQNLFFELQ